MKLLRLIPAILALFATEDLLMPGMARAQCNNTQCGDYYHQPQCGSCGDVGCERCYRCAPPESADLPEEGVFVAPQPTGEVQGESSSVGIRFGSFRIPSITIEMPTFQLPSLVKFRRDARMLTERGVAPFHTRGVAEFDVRPRRGVPEEEPPEADDFDRCGSVSQADRRIQELEAQIAELNNSLKQLAEIQLSQMQQQQGQAPIRQTSAQQTHPAPPVETPPVQTPPEPAQPARKVKQAPIFSESLYRRLETGNPFDLASTKDRICENEPAERETYRRTSHKEERPFSRTQQHDVPPRAVVQQQTTQRNW